MIRCCGTGFNRYIVECKCDNKNLAEIDTYRFNRYIVECKFENYDRYEKLSHGFNRYIVECKLIASMPFVLNPKDLIDT